MKYIRTKDGRIIDLSDCELDDENEECYYYIQHEAEYGFEIRKNDIIKQADSIEKVCDEYVVKYKYKDKPETIRCLNNELRLIRRYILSIIKEIEFVKLAIWTDKGLIYVAKMNEKGELELL